MPPLDPERNHCLTNLRTSFPSRLKHSSQTRGVYAGGLSGAPQHGEVMPSPCTASDVIILDLAYFTSLKISKTTYLDGQTGGCRQVAALRTSTFLESSF